MLGEEVGDTAIHLIGGLAEVSVAAVGDGDEIGRDAGLDELLIEADRLSIGNEGVGGAVDVEDGWVVFGDMGDRGGATGFFFVLKDGAAEEEGLWRVGGIVIHGAGVVAHGEHFSGAEEVDHGIDAAALIEVRADLTLELFDLARGAEHGDEMASGGSAPDGDLFWVEIVFLGARTNPADRGLAVVDLRGPLGFIAQAVGDTDSGVVATGNEGGQTLEAGTLVARPPSSTVDEDDDGEGFVGGWFLGEIEIDHLPRVVIGSVGEVGGDPDIFVRLGSWLRFTRAGEVGLVFPLGDEAVTIGVDLAKVLLEGLWEFVFREFPVVVFVPIFELALLTEGE